MTPTPVVLSTTGDVGVSLADAATLQPVVIEETLGLSGADRFRCDGALRSGGAFRPKRSRSTPG